MTSLNPLLRVGRQISEVLELHQHLRKKEAMEKAVGLLKSVGITEAERRAKDLPHHFSGGMRQRVMIAMAISCRPQLIIADEPTTALDATIQAQLLELIHGVSLESGTSVIVISHNLGIVARYARRVYVMYAGGIVEHGPANAIYHAPLHPYTAGLLASVPRLDEPRKTRLSSIEGQPPDLISLPHGCIFHPRCCYSIAECREGKRELAEIAPGHFSACNLAVQGVMPWQKKT